MQLKRNVELQMPKYDQATGTTYFPQTKSTLDFYCFPSCSMSTAIFAGLKITKLGSFHYFFRRQMGKISCDHQQFLSSWAAIHIGAHRESKGNEPRNAACKGNASRPHSSSSCPEKQKVTLPRARKSTFDSEGRYELL